MDHGGMNHGGMGHGDMDMGGDKCSMNVSASQHSPPHLRILTLADVIYMVLEEPVHHLQSMARHGHIILDHVIGRDRTPHSRLRMCTRDQSKI